MKPGKAARSCPKCGEPARRVILRAAWVKCELLDDGSYGRILGCGTLKGVSAEEYECGGMHTWVEGEEDVRNGGGISRSPDVKDPCES